MAKRGFDMGLLFVGIVIGFSGGFVWCSLRLLKRNKAESDQKHDCASLLARDLEMREGDQLRNEMEKWPYLAQEYFDWVRKHDAPGKRDPDWCLYEFLYDKCLAGLPIFGVHIKTREFLRSHVAPKSETVETK